MYNLCLSFRHSRSFEVTAVNMQLAGAPSPFWKFNETQLKPCILTRWNRKSSSKPPEIWSEVSLNYMISSIPGIWDLLKPTWDLLKPIWDLLILVLKLCSETWNIVVTLVKPEIRVYLYMKHVENLLLKLHCYWTRKARVLKEWCFTIVIVSSSMRKTSMVPFGIASIACANILTRS